MTVSLAELEEEVGPGRSIATPRQLYAAVATALGIGGLVVITGQALPQRMPALPWFVAAVDGLVILALVMVVALGVGDALSRGDGRALPLAAACAGSAALWIPALLLRPGVIPGGLWGDTALGASLTPDVARVGTASLICWSLFQPMSVLRRPAMTVATTVIIAILAGTACATVVLALSAHLIGGGDIAAESLERSMVLLGLIPPIVAVVALLRGELGRRRIDASAVAAMILAAVDGLLSLLGPPEYSGRWYAWTLLRLLPAGALLLGQDALHRQSVSAGIDALRAERARVRELTLLQEVGRALSWSLDRDAILHAAVRYAAGVVPTEAVSTQVLDVSGGAATVVAEHRARRAPSFMGVTVTLDDHPHMKAVLLTGAAARWRAGTSPYDHELSAPEARACACVPVRTGPLTLGLITLWSQRSEMLGDDDLRVLEGIGVLTGLALTNADSYRRLQTAAASDHLTGLYNRREFERILHGMRGRAYAILVIDVDNLKVINDTYGHEAGDATLRSVAGVLRADIRPGDIVARVGGDEFAALLPDTNEVEAVAVAERMRSAMEAVPTPNRLGSISVGCAWTGPGGDSRTVWEQADEALYRAKRDGRNRVEVGHLRGSTDSGPGATRWDALVEPLLSSRGIRSVYQPIVRFADRAVVGHEALARPAESTNELSVEGLFATAQRLGLGSDLDWLCRRAAVEHIDILGPRQALFINVGVSALLDPLHDVDQMLLLLEWAGGSARDVVLEITEREAVRDLGRFEQVVASYRAAGFRFALDDVGEGHSTFELLAAAAPEFVKVSSMLVQRRHDLTKSRAIRGIVAYAGSSGAQVVAEGLETLDDVESVAELGVTLGQGWVLGRPVIPEGPGAGEWGGRPPRLRVRTDGAAALHGAGGGGSPPGPRRLRRLLRAAGTAAGEPRPRRCAC